MFKTRLAASVLAVILGASALTLSVSPALATPSSSSAVDFPDLTGKRADVVAEFVTNVKLKATYAGQGKGKFVKNNYVVASQKPDAGTPVKKGTKVSFRVVKKSDVVNGNIAGGACIEHARNAGAIPDGSSALMGGIPSAPTKLGVIVRIPLIAMDTDTITGYIKCEYSGTKKKHSLVTFEAQGPLG